MIGEEFVWMFAANTQDREERHSERTGKAWLDLKQKTFHELLSKSGLPLQGTKAQKEDQALLHGMVGRHRRGREVLVRKPPQLPLASASCPVGLIKIPTLAGFGIKLYFCFSENLFGTKNSGLGSAAVILLCSSFLPS